METFLSGVLDEVLVGANTGGLEGLGTQLLILVGDEVDAEREVVDVCTLAAQVEDADLRVGYTTVEPGLGVGLVEEESQQICCSIENVDVAPWVSSIHNHRRNPPRKLQMLPLTKQIL